MLFYIRQRWLDITCPVSTCQVGLCLLLLLYSDHCAVLHKIKTLFCCAVSLFTLCCFLVHSVLCCAGPLSVWLVVLLLRSAGQTDQWQLSLQWADKPQHGPSQPSSTYFFVSSSTSLVSYLSCLVGNFTMSRSLTDAVKAGNIAEVIVQCSCDKLVSQLRSKETQLPKCDVKSLVNSIISRWRSD